MVIEVGVHEEGAHYSCFARRQRAKVTPVIPYFELPHLSLPFGQKIDIFGLLSAAGVVVGATLAGRQSRLYSPGDDEPMRESVTWMVLCGLFGGHFMHLFAYHPELLTA
jgi:phosphatidylglycerol:prolipoprotein diacylglycerol transferase